MSRIAVVRISEYEGGSVESISDAFIRSAEEKGHVVEKVTTRYEKACHCGGHCCQNGGDGCGDEDCLCTFAKTIPDCDCLVFAFPVDRGFSPTALNRIVHKATFDCMKSPDVDGKKMFVIATSEMFDEIYFNDALSVMKLECGMKNWSYAGELLVPGLPDACLGADPVSCRKASRLADRI